MTYKELVEKERQMFIGKNVIYKGEPHKIVDVDYNGALLIDLETPYNATTALNRFDKDLQIL